MATGALTRTDSAAEVPARHLGRLDRLLRFVDSLPGSAAAWWLGIGLALAAVGHLIVWTVSGRPFGQILHDVLAPALIFAWFMWLIHTLNRVAVAAFEDFRPALGDSQNEARYLEQLTTISDRRAIVAAISAMAIVAFAYYVGVRPARDLVPVEIEIVSAPLWGLTSIALGIAILHTITQLRLVSHLSSIARNVDIFKPASINSFSRLTAVGAIGLIAFVVAFVLFSPEQPLPYIIQESIVLAVAAASFVLPLRVMHDRLVAEKKRLLGDSQERLKSVLASIHGAVDANDLSRSEQLHHSLSAVLAEQEVLTKLHTWPWSTATIRGFASALLVPIGLIVFTQVVARLLG